MTTPTSLEQLSAQVQILAAQVEELTWRLEQATGLPKWVGSGEEGEPKLVFVTAEEWVTGLFLPMFSWRIDGQRWFWCPQWWQHAEAIWRLELLWRSWEAARLQPTGMSAWSMELDHHLRRLLGDEGPFRQCRAAEGDRPARHIDAEIATTQPAPVGWWET